MQDTVPLKHFVVEGTLTYELSARWISSHLPGDEIQNILKVAQDVFEDEVLAKE